MGRTWFAIGAVAAALAVALGAFGAHALRSRVDPGLLSTWQTAVDYHFYHALGLLAVGAVLQRWPASAALRWSARLLLLGMLLFCGSLYLLVLFEARWLGALTPLGGIAFMAGWLLLAFAAWRTR